MSSSLLHILPWSARRGGNFGKSGLAMKAGEAFFRIVSEGPRVWQRGVKLASGFAFLLVLCAPGFTKDLSVSIDQVDTALEQAMASMDSADPARESLLKSYRDIRALLQGIAQHEADLETYSAARTNDYEEAQRIRAELEVSLAAPVPAVDQTLELAELEQKIQVEKSDLVVLQNRLAAVTQRKDAETDRPAGIRERLTGLGASLSDLEADLKLISSTVEPESVDQARQWMAEAQLAGNRAEKAALDEELLSRPMRLELLVAQQDQLNQQITALEKRLVVMEQQSSGLRQGEAEAVLAAAETAQADALGKHILVQESADNNTVISASIGERGSAIEGFRARELESTAQAEEFERELAAIERKLEILGMTKTVGEILREQAVRLPRGKLTDRELASIAELVGDSSLRQMELQDQRRELRDIQAFVERKLALAESATTAAVRDDLLQLALNRRELVSRAIELESTYSRALTDLDFAVHRLSDAADELAAFISERLLWIQSRDPLSWSLAADFSGQMAESFAPSRWAALVRWVALNLFVYPVVPVLLFLVAGLYYLTPAIKHRLLATGRSVGFVRSDSFVETLIALLYTLILTVKWPLLMLALAIPIQHYSADTDLAGALYIALLRASYYFLGLEFIRCLMLPRGLVESHFRWPQERVKQLHRRIVRFEQTFIFPTFLAVLFLFLYPTDVGGAGGTFAVVVLLLSMAYFFYRMPHFVQGKMDRLFAEVQTSIHGFWGSLVRTLLAWVPIVLIVAVLFGYTYTAIEFSLLLIQTLVLFTSTLLLHELGMRWLRVTRRRLKLKVQEELALAQETGADDTEIGTEDEVLEHDPDILDDEGTKFLNALLLIGSVLGIVVIFADVFPALGILDSVELWQRTDSVNGADLVVQTTLSDVFGALVIGLLGWVVVRRVPSLFELLLRQRVEIPAASAYAVATVTKYFLTTVVVVTVLSMLGGRWSQIQWAVAALSLGIGFGLQEIVANFFSGLIILFEQPIRVGDTVTIGDTSGVVTKINMRATTIRDWDRRELLVPNKEFVTGRLLNWSLTDPITRLQIEVGVAYGTDMDEALEIVRLSAADHPVILADPAPFVTFDEFGDNSLTIVLRCYLEALETRLTTASAIRLEINRRLAAEGISIAFPQRDVHLDARSPLDIRLVNPAAPPAGEN